MNKVPTVTLFIAAFGHYLVADFISAAHGKTIPVNAPPKAALTVTGSTSASIERFDAVLGRELRPVPPSYPQRFYGRG